MPRGKYTHKRTAMAVRFWPKVDRSGGPDACWPFTGHRCTRGGYGLIWNPAEGARRQTRAHRVAWELTHGAPLADTEVIRHTCDNPICCNPTHLQRGTQHENVLDMLQKGRYANGWRRGSLTMVQVIEIRQRAGERRATLAQEFGVSETTIYQILAGKTWRGLSVR